MTVRNHIIDNSAVLAKQIEDRQLYQAKKRGAMMVKYWSPAVVQAHVEAKMEDVKRSKRMMAKLAGLIK